MIHIVVIFKLSGPAMAPFLAVAMTAASLLILVFSDSRQRAAPGAPARADVRAGLQPARLMPGPYRAEAIRVVDGDTFEARLRIWFNQEVTVLVRLDGVDAPELRGRCERESRMAVESRDALAAILSSGPVLVRDLHPDKYNGRAVARASVGGDDVAALLEAGGYARPYDGRARSPWCGAQPPLLAQQARPR